MQVIKVIQVGMGPLGIKIAQMIAGRSNLKTIAAIDKKADLVGRDLGELCGATASGVLIENDFSAAVEKERPDVAILSTVSDMRRIAPQIEEIVGHGVPVVSTCEELCYPWDEAPSLASRIDEAAKAGQAAVLGTGVNPGFLMDALPTFLTAVCQDVKRIRVNRYQNAQFRRIPFQQKIGAGLTLSEFEAKKQEGTLRHVGLTESMQLIAQRMGWRLHKTEDIISPVIAQHEVVTDAMRIPKGKVTGVRQVGRAYINDEVKIELTFQAAVGESESYDEVFIEGTPDIHSRIQGGVNGDIATCAIVLNAIPRVIEAAPGLKTMMEIAPVSFAGG